jgi:hypothetical protein
MVCYATLREEALQRLRLKLPPLTDDEIRELLSVKTHAEVHAAIGRLTDSELLAVVTEAIRRKARQKVLKEQILTYA